MTGEMPQPEMEPTPEAQLFNVDAMSDEQIIVLYRSLGETQYGHNDMAEFGVRWIGNDLLHPLWGRLTADVRDLATRNPERVKRLAERCMGGSIGIDYDFAIYIIPGLIEHDYEFTRDTLADVYCYEREMPDGLQWTNPPDTARDMIQLLMRDRLTPEQIADFNAQIMAHDDHPPLSPAEPDKPYW